MTHKAQRIVVLVAAGMLLAGSAMAGIQVTAKLQHKRIMQFEPVNLFVTVYNDTGERFFAGKKGDREGARIIFEIRRSGRGMADRVKEGQMFRAFRLRPGERQDLMIDISTWYDVAATDSYMVQAVVEWNGVSYESNTAGFEVVNGLPLVEQSRSVEGYPDVVRTYGLRYLVRDNREALFFSVDEEGSGENFGVFALGPLLRVAKPIMNIGRNGSIVIVHMSTPGLFVRSEFLSLYDGVRFIDQRYFNTKGEAYGEEEDEGEGDESAEGEDVSGTDEAGASGPARSAFDWLFRRKK